MDNLQEAQLNRNLEVALAAKTVGPSARFKLRHLLAFYAKKKHPFTACVRDNTKRFGPERAKQVCATLKDIIMGTTKWRKGRQTLSEDEVDSIEISNDQLKVFEEAMKDEDFANYINDLLEK